MFVESTDSSMLTIGRVTMSRFIQVNTSIREAAQQANMYLLRIGF